MAINLRLLKLGEGGFVSCAQSVLNLGRPIEDILDGLSSWASERDIEGAHIGTKSAVGKAEKWMRDAERNCGMNLDRSKKELYDIMDAVDKKDPLLGFLAYDRFKAAVYEDVGDWAREVG